VHECFRKGLVDLINQRFAETHQIEWIRQSPSVRRDLPDWVSGLSHLDQILCSWEWRAGPPARGCDEERIAAQPLNRT